MTEEKPSKNITKRKENEDSQNDRDREDQGNMRSKHCQYYTEHIREEFTPLIASRSEILTMMQRRYDVH